MDNEDLIEFVVMIAKPGQPLLGIGGHKFRVPPRTGDFVTLDDESGKGQAYRVKAVIHPLEPAPTAGDLVLEYISTDIELMKNF